MIDVLVKLALSLATLGLGGAVALLWRTVTSNRDAVRELKREAATRETAIQLEARVKRLEDDKVTVEGVREVFEESLAKYEQAAEKRREERAARYRLETVEIVRKTFREELRGSDKFRRSGPSSA